MSFIDTYCTVADRQMGCVWAHRFDSAEAVLGAGGIILGDPSFGPEGVTLDGTNDYLQFRLPTLLNVNSCSVVFEFTPEFEHDEGVVRYFWDIENGSGSNRHRFLHDSNANYYLLSFNSTAIDSINENEVETSWKTNQRNRLVVASTSGNTDVFLNGVGLTIADVTAWSVGTHTRLTVGAHNANVGGTAPFKGTVHGIKIFNATFGTEVVEKISRYNNRHYWTLDGSSDYLSRAATKGTELDLNEFSVLVSVIPNTVSGSHWHVSNSGAAAKYGWATYTFNDGLSYFVSKDGGIGAGSSTALALASVAQVSKTLTYVATYKYVADGTSEMGLYLDSTNKSEVSNAVGPPNFDTNTFGLGIFLDGANTLDGSLSFVGYFNKKFTEAEALALISDFNDNRDSIDLTDAVFVQDFSVDPEKSPVYTQSLDGKKYPKWTFDGVQDELLIRNADGGSDFFPSGSFTVMACIRPNGASGTHMIMTAGDVFNSGWDLRVSGGTDYGLFVRSTTGSSSCQAAATVVDKKLSCVVGTYEYVGDGTSELNLYVDDLPTTTTAGATGPVESSTLGASIGNHWQSQNYQFPGDIEFIAFWDDTVLSEAEAESLMALWRAGTLTEDDLGDVMMWTDFRSDPNSDNLTTQDATAYKFAVGGCPVFGYEDQRGSGVYEFTNTGSSYLTKISHEEDAVSLLNRAHAYWPMTADTHNTDSVAGSPNLFRDANMELSTFGDVWVNQNNPLLTKESGARTGGKGTRYGKIAYQGTANPGVFQNVLTNGETYQVSGWYRTDGASNGVIISQDGSINLTLPATTSWTYFTRTVSHTAGTALYVRSASSGAGQYLEVDDLDVRLVSDQSLDVSGNGFHFTINGNLEKLAGSGYYFPGDGSSYLTIDNNNLLPCKPFTLACLVKYDPNSQEDFAHVMGNADWTGANVQGVLMRATSSNALQFASYNSGGTTSGIAYSKLLYGMADTRFAGFSVYENFTSSLYGSVYGTANNAYYTDPQLGFYIGRNPELNDGDSDLLGYVYKAAVWLEPLSELQLRLLAAHWLKEVNS